MARAKSSKPSITKGVGAAMQPGATLAPVTTNLPDTAISVAAQINQFNALQPTQCYEMSVPCRKAVSAIVGQGARAEVRIFTTDGDEVVGGDLFNLIKRPATNWSTRRFLNDIMSFDLIAGEIAIDLMLDQNTGRPIGMLPLAPNRLYPIDPTTPNELCDIRLWQYTYNSGQIGQIQNADTMRGLLGKKIPAECIIFSPNFNTSSHIRGLSPFITGVNAASVNYQALRYFKDYYTNNAVPSHIIVLQKGLSEKQRKDWEQRYLEQYSTFNNQSQKVIVSSGTDLDIKKLESEQKTDQQIALLNYTIDELAMLFSITPTAMGMWNRVRFETAAIERSQFLEDTVLPAIARVQDVLQFQLVDRFFSMSKIVRGKSKLPIKKNLRNLLDKKLNDNVGSEYIIVLDPDTIPLMSQVNLDQFTALDALCTKGRLSPNEAAEYLGIELPANPLRDKIFISTTLQELKEDMSDAGVTPQRDAVDLKVQADTGHTNDTSKRTMAETESDDKTDTSPETQKKVKSLHDQYRTVRKMVLINNQDNKVYSLAEADALCKHLYDSCPTLKTEIRKDLFNLKRLTKNMSVEDRAVEIKAYYNGKKNAYLRGLI